MKACQSFVIASRMIATPGSARKESAQFVRRPLDALADAVRPVHGPEQPVHDRCRRLPDLLERVARRRDVVDVDQRTFVRLHLQLLLGLDRRRQGS